MAPPSSNLNVEVQTRLRENESQTAAFDLIQPPSWYFVHVEPWVFELKTGFRRPRKHSEEEIKEDEERIFGRGKEVVPVRMAPLVFPNRVAGEWEIPAVEDLVEQKGFIEPFKNLFIKELIELEPQLRITVNVEEWLQGDFKAMTDAYARRATRSTKGRSLARAIPRQRHYSVQVGKHRRVLTPRCDPSLVLKLERLTAIVLFQRCLRGRAAQISVLETRHRCIGLYQELNQLEEEEDEDEEEEAAAAAAAAADDDQTLWNTQRVVGKFLSDALESLVIPNYGNTDD